jgi:hypothetical protein
LVGIDLDLNDLVWAVLLSGHVASFERSKCKGPINGPTAATGKHCPEGWTLYQMPGPQMRGAPIRAAPITPITSGSIATTTLGLGANVPIASANGGGSLLALVNGRFVDLRVPYPLGFFTKNVDGRIDDPNVGWKGRGLWTTSGRRTVFHGERATRAQPKLFKLQIRPDPLAH